MSSRGPTSFDAEGDLLLSTPKNLFAQPPRDAARRTVHLFCGQVFTSSRRMLVWQVDEGEAVSEKRPSFGVVPLNGGRAGRWEAILLSAPFCRLGAHPCTVPLLRCDEWQEKRWRAAGHFPLENPQKRPAKVGAALISRRLLACQSGLPCTNPGQDTGRLRMALGAKRCSLLATPDISDLR